jgi:hypothetical protein
MLNFREIPFAGSLVSEKTSSRQLVNRGDPDSYSQYAARTSLGYYLLKRPLRRPSPSLAVPLPLPKRPLTFFSVAGEGTNGLQHSAPDLIQCPFGFVSFASLHLVRHLLDVLTPYPRFP